MVIGTEVAMAITYNYNTAAGFILVILRLVCKGIYNTFCHYHYQYLSHVGSKFSSIFSTSASFTPASCDGLMCTSMTG